MNIFKKYISTFFTKGHSRTLLAKKNIAASFVVKGLSVLINLALVPLTINYVNPSQYGIWLTLSSIIAWFSFFDVGFGHGLRNKFAEAKALGEFEKARSYVSTTYAVLFLLFFTVWCIFYVCNFFIDWTKILNTPSEMIEELSILAIIVFSFFCLQIVLKTINTLIIADQKPAKAAFFDMLGQLIALIIIYTLTKHTQGSLIYLGLSLGFAPVGILIISSLYFYFNEYKYYRPTLKLVNFSLAKDIFNLGFKFFFIQIAVIVIYQTNNIIIAQTGTPEDVTTFNIAYKYMSIALLLFSIVVSPFWSAFTDAHTKKDYLWMRASLKKLRLISYGLIGMLLVLVLIANDVYKFWIGDLVTIPFKISIIVAIYMVMLIVVSLHTQILNGLGKIKIQLITYSLATIFHIPLAVVLGKLHGITGVLVSAILFYFIISFFTIIQVNKLIGNRANGIWSK